MGETIGEHPLGSPGIQVRILGCEPRYIERKKLIISNKHQIKLHSATYFDSLPIPRLKLLSICSNSCIVVAAELLL